MPVDWSQLAGSLVRTLRANQAASQQEQALSQGQQQLNQGQQRLGIEQQNEKLSERAQTLNEGLSAPTVDSWKAYKAYADSLPPAQRMEAYRDILVPGALKLQAQQGQVEQLRQDLTENLSNALGNAKPEDAKVLGALIGEIQGAPDLVTLRQLENKANTILAGETKPPPALQFTPGPYGVPISRSASGYSMGIPGITSPAGGGAAPAGGAAASIPGMSTSSSGVPYFRRPSSTETTAADTIQQALDQIDALTPELENYAAASGPEPTSKLGKIGGAAERFGEFGAYKFGIDTEHGEMFTDASQLYAQIAGALTRTGPRSVRYLHELSPHIPKATDDPALLLKKIKKWREILARDQAQLAAGPFPPDSGAPVPSSPRSAAGPSPKVQPKHAGGETFYRDSAGLHYFEPGKGWVTVGGP